MVMVTPAMSYFLHAGLCRHGYVEESFRMFRERFDHMLGAGTNRTLWEEWWLDQTGRTGTLAKTVTRSDAQTESAFPPMLFTEYILGVRPTQPGLAEVTLSLFPSGLRQIEGGIPSPEGILRVRWKLDDEVGRLAVDIPGEMRVKLDLTSLEAVGAGKILVDGSPLEDGPRKKEYVQLRRGSHHVEF